MNELFNKPLEPLKKFKASYMVFKETLVHMAMFYARQGCTVCSLNFDEEKATSHCYNCKEVNLTYLFTLKGIGGTEAIQSLFEITTKLAVIIILCPPCTKKYDEDSTILINVAEDIKLTYKTKLQLHIEN